MYLEVMTRFAAERRYKVCGHWRESAQCVSIRFTLSERFRTSGERAQVLAAKCAGYHFFLGILLDFDFWLRKSHHGRISYTLAFSWQVSSPSVVGIRPTARVCSSARQTGMQQTPQRCHAISPQHHHNVIPFGDWIKGMPCNNRHGRLHSWSEAESIATFHSTRYRRGRPNDPEKKRGVLQKKLCKTKIISLCSVEGFISRNMWQNTWRVNRISPMFHCASCQSPGYWK